MFIQSACATGIVRFLIACEHKCILLFLFRSYIPCVYQAEPFHPLCPEIHKGARMLPLTTSQRILKREVRAACCVILKSGQSEASDATYSMVAAQWNPYLLGRSSRWVKCMYSSSVVAMTSLCIVISSTPLQTAWTSFKLYLW